MLVYLKLGSSIFRGSWHLRLWWLKFQAQGLLSTVVLSGLKRFNS